MGEGAPRQTWDPDIEIGADLAARLIAEQFPDLAPVQLETLEKGWDNAAYCVNGSLIFRFPCRRSAAHLVERENAILPLLAPHLTLPVPIPIYIGRKSAHYPFVFHGYARIPGRTATSRRWTGTERSANAAPLARFLAGLHAVTVTEETRDRAPGDEIGRSDPETAIARIDQRLAQLESAHIALDYAAVREAAGRLRLTPAWPHPARWVHGDLYPRQILVDDEGAVTGVIDWGDAHLGDPALDLSIAFTLVPGSARDSFREAYGPIDPDTWARARLRALHYGAILLLYGHSISNEQIAETGRFALEEGMER
jgi:aminoglycoside phosphotransferase (APT) family kinase protein